MKKEVKEALRCWNKFIEGYQLAQEGWEEFSKLVGFGGLHLEEFPLEAQRALSRCNPKATFTVVLPRFADYVRRYAGDASTLIIPIEEEKPKEEKPKPKKEEVKKGD